MWEINSVSQISGSLFALLLGVLLSLTYDVIRALRKIGFKSFVLVFLGDILFSFLSAIITFLFLLVFTNGAIRAYVLFFEVLGFLLCRITFSKIFLKILIMFFSYFKKTFAYISALLLLFSKKTEEFFGKIYSFIKKTFKKRPKSAKRS